jgi:hypothetical protein
MEKIKFKAWDKITQKHYKVKSLNFDKDGNIDFVRLYDNENHLFFMERKIDEIELTESVDKE